MNEAGRCLINQMRNLILSALILASAFQTALGAVSGEWTYLITYSGTNGEATISAYSGTGGAVTIPTNLGGFPVTKVGNGLSSVFSGQLTGVTSVVLPSGITAIGEGAFSGCANLMTISIPNSVVSIEHWAFRGCNSLTNITLPDSVTSLGVGAFINCANLTRISLGSNVTSIPWQLFQNCTSLSDVRLGNIATSIGLAAFSNCTSLVKITIPSSIRVLDPQAFAGCNALAQIVFLGNAPSYSSNSFLNSTPTAYYVTGTTGWSSSYAGLRTAVLGSYLLTTICNVSEGVLSVNPIKEAYLDGDSVTIVATPKAGYLFSNWSGESVVTTSSITLTMNMNKTVTANFSQDGSDNDSDDLTNYQESVVYGTNPNQKDSNGDGVEDGQAVSMGYNPTLNFSALIAHPPTGLYTASQMQAMAIGDLVLTKNANGSFTLNYDIEQSTDLQNWSIYAPLSLPLTGLPTDKAFVRIKAKQNGSGSQSAPTSSTPTTDINNGANWNSQQNTMGSPVEGAPGT